MQGMRICVKQVNFSLIPHNRIQFNSLNDRVFCKDLNKTFFYYQKNVLKFESNPTNALSKAPFHYFKPFFVYLSLIKTNAVSLSQFGTSLSRKGTGDIHHAVVNYSTSMRIQKTSKIVRSSASQFSNVTADDLAVICFDLETTGIGSSFHRIIEIAAKDIAGGGISTMQSLVNPGREVPLMASKANNITTDMVFRPDIPRFRIVAKAFVEFVELRRKDKKFVILAAHNAKRFDIPFLLNEFELSHVKMPSDWLFLDTLLLVRHGWKNLPSGKTKPEKLNLQYLHSEHFGLTSQGIAHRAMVDVNMLSEVLLELIYEFNLSPSSILDHCFRAQPNTETVYNTE